MNTQIAAHRNIHTANPAAASRPPESIPTVGRLLALSPYNPYILPVDRSVKGWAVWGLQGLGLSLGGTLIWDRAAHSDESQGGFMKAPAQWVSAAVLAVVAVIMTFTLGAPWSVVPLAGAAVVGLRRVLASQGQGLRLEASLAGATRKCVLAGAGIGIWAAAVAAAGWLDGILGEVRESPALRLGGDGAAKSVAGLSSAGDRLVEWGSGACVVMAVVAVLWWVRDAYLDHTELPGG